MTQCPNCIPPCIPSYIITCTFRRIAAWVISYCTCFTPQIKSRAKCNWNIYTPHKYFHDFSKPDTFYNLKFPVFLWPRKPWISELLLVCLSVQSSARSREQRAHLNTSGWTGDSSRKTTTSSGKNRNATNVSNVTRNTFPLYVLKHTNNKQVRYIYLKRTHFTLF